MNIDAFNDCIWSTDSCGRPHISNLWLVLWGPSWGRSIQVRNILMCPTCGQYFEAYQIILTHWSVGPKLTIFFLSFQNFFKNFLPFFVHSIQQRVPCGLVSNHPIPLWSPCLRFWMGDSRPQVDLTWPHMSWLIAQCVYMHMYVCIYVELLYIYFDRIGMHLVIIYHHIFIFPRFLVWGWFLQPVHI